MSLLQESTFEEIAIELKSRLPNGFILAFNNSDDPLNVGDMSMYFGEDLGESIKLLKYTEWLLHDIWMGGEDD